VLRASNLGTPVTICSSDSAAARAYTAAARRLAGENIEMTIPPDKKGFFNKLFGRRAA
jgi:septum site-determining protein MinD